MKIIKDTFKIDLDVFSLEIFDENSLFYDIETTGLSRKYNSIYLIGTLSRVGDLATLTQYFADTPNDEKEVLDSFFEDSNSFNKLISFNGISFDAPFIIERATKYNILCENFKASEQYDIYKIIKTYRKLLDVDSMSQKSVEHFLEVDRDDLYNGGQLIEVYNEYTLFPDDKLLDLLLLHNYDDVKNMPVLLEALKYPNIRSLANFETVYFEDLPSKNQLHLQFKLKCPVKQMLSFKADSTTFTVNNSEFDINIDLSNTTMNYYLENYKDYIYLLSENTVVPKILATTIPSCEKRQAKKEECFTKKRGVFLPIPQGLACAHKTYKESYSDKTSYVDIEEIRSDMTFMISYFNALLSSYKL